MIGSLGADARRRPRGGSRRRSRAATSDDGPRGRRPRELDLGGRREEGRRPDDARDRGSSPAVLVLVHRGDPRPRGVAPPAAPDDGPPPREGGPGLIVPRVPGVARVACPVAVRAALLAASRAGALARLPARRTPIGAPAARRRPAAATSARRRTLRPRPGDASHPGRRRRHGPERQAQPASAAGSRPATSTTASASAIQPEAVHLRATQDGRSRWRLKVVRRDGYRLARGPLPLVALLPPDGQAPRSRSTCPAGAPRSTSDVRVGPAFATFAAWAFGDAGTVRIVVPAALPTPSTAGPRGPGDAPGPATRLQRSAPSTDDPIAWYAQVNATARRGADQRPARPGRRRAPRRSTPGPRTRAGAAASPSCSANGLPELARRIGLPWPVRRPVDVFEVHTPAPRGLRRLLRPGVRRIEISEDLDDLTILHEASHAWFNERLFDGALDQRGPRRHVRVAGARRARPQRLDGPDSVKRGADAAVRARRWPPPGRSRRRAPTPASGTATTRRGPSCARSSARSARTGCGGCSRPPRPAQIAYAGAGTPRRRPCPTTGAGCSTCRRARRRGRRTPSSGAGRWRRRRGRPADPRARRRGRPTRRWPRSGGELGAADASATADGRAGGSGRRPTRWTRRRPSSSAATSWPRWPTRRASCRRPTRDALPGRRDSRATLAVRPTTSARAGRADAPSATRGRCRRRSRATGSSTLGPRRRRPGGRPRGGPGGVGGGGPGRGAVRRRGAPSRPSMPHPPPGGPRATRHRRLPSSVALLARAPGRRRARRGPAPSPARRRPRRPGGGCRRTLHSPTTPTRPSPRPPRRPRRWSPRRARRTQRRPRTP